MAIEVRTQQRQTATPLTTRPRAGGGERRIPRREVTRFFSQVALMLEVGTSLADAMQAIARQTKNPQLRALLDKMVHDLEEGLRLSVSMDRRTDVFDGVTRSIVKAGEAGGFLKDSLVRLVEFQEKRDKLLGQLKASLAYPAFLLIAAVGVVLFILLGLLPKFTTFFEGKEHLLPVTTRLLMTFSDSVRSGWYVYLIVIVGAVALARFWLRTARAKLLKDRLVLQIPGIAGLTNKVCTTRMLRTIGNLLSSDVSLLEALAVTRATVDNVFYREFIDRLGTRIETGETFSHAFSEFPHIDDSVKHMIATGENTGSLPVVMLRLADFYDNEVEQLLRAISSLVEPVALVLLGGIIGTVISAVILPMFRLAHAVQ